MFLDGTTESRMFFRGQRILRRLLVLEELEVVTISDFLGVSLTLEISLFMELTVACVLLGDSGLVEIELYALVLLEESVFWFMNLLYGDFLPCVLI